MDRATFSAWAAQGVMSAPPGLELPQDAAWDIPTPPGLGKHQQQQMTTTASGARTPDFMTATAWPGAAAAEQTDGAITPRDGSEVSKVIMDQLCSKLRSLEMKGFAATTPMDEVQKVPMPHSLLSTHGVRSAPPPPMSTTPPPAYCWGQGAPGLPPPPQPPQSAQFYSQAPPPPPPAPVVPRPAARAARAAAAAPAQQEKKFVVSIGSVGHPYECGRKCERENCDLGMNCPDCHLCKAEEVAEETRAAAVAQQSQDPCPSVGSIGHAQGKCAEACKFHFKVRGCKDGALCTRCHICRWTRYQKKIRKGDEEYSEYVEQ